MNHLTKTRPTGILDKHKFVIKFPRSRGDSGALYLQSATAGVMRLAPDRPLQSCLV